MKKGIWLVSADMGYGHHRAVQPLRPVARNGIITVGRDGAGSGPERRLWRRLLGVYESFSRARGIPLIGKPLFAVLDSFLQIPSFYPIRDLSRSTFQVDLLASSIRQGLCSSLIGRIRSDPAPLVTSFYAPAVAADMAGLDGIYCIICDADLNRVWVARAPWESRINYFAPCGKAAQRLRAYGVAEERVFLTGFPLPPELLGGPDLPTLRADLGQRLHYLDPNDRFWPLHGKNVEHFLGEDQCVFRRERVLTIAYAVGGAGAQMEIGRRIALSLRDRIIRGALRLLLLPGVRPEVRDYFLEVQREVAPGHPGLRVLESATLGEYFRVFNGALRETDILWTKPSELSFYAGLGIPIIMTPTIGSHEKFNRRWLFEIQAGIRQENPDHTDQWLFDWLDNGRLAEAAWSGFLKARKLGVYKILEILETGTMRRDPSPVMR